MAGTLTLASKRLSIVLGSMVSVLIIGEILLRVASPVSADRLLPFPYNDDRVRRISAEQTYIRFDQELGWRTAPAQERREDGKVFRTNREGLRADTEYSLQAAEGARRLAAFGDSFTYCAEVTQADCWIALLETSWLDTQVLNFGVPAYGPDQAWLRYQRDGRQYGACGVLIGYLVANVERVVNRFSPFLLPDDGIVLGKPRFLLDGDGLRLLPNPVTDPRELRDPRWAEATLGPHDAWFFPGVFVPSPLDMLMTVRVGRTAAYQWSRRALRKDEQQYPLYDDGQEAYEVTRRVLRGFAEQVRSDGATPIVLVFPAELDLASHRAGYTPYAKLTTWLEAAGIGTIDLTEPLARQAEVSGVRSLFETTHYSRLGNAIVADVLRRELPPRLAGICP